MSSLKSKGCLFLASSLCDGLEDNNIKQVTTLLLNTEANPNTLIPMHGVTPFHLVIGNDSETFAEEVTKLFLRHGGNPNVRSVDGLTPVHVAAAWGRVTVLELLLANGGDPLCLDDEGRSPFHYAFDGKYYEAIAVLGKYCDNIVKEEKSTNYKVTFDKLVINDGNVIAEYAAVQIPDIIKESELNKNEILKHNEEKSTDTRVKYFCNLGDNSLSSDNQFAVDASEFRINEERSKEKMLVNEIINQLSSSLKSNFQQQEVNNKRALTSERTDYDTSPLSTISTDNSIMYNMKNQFLLKNRRRRSITPKYRRKNFKQNNNTRIPLIPACNVNDYIISKSPNLLIGESFEKEQEYLSPKISQKELKFKTFTPCAARNQPFQSEFNTEKAIARSTPRRRKQFYRQYSSCRKLKRSNGLTSSENTSPDSASPDTLSPHHSYIKKPNYKLNKNLVIKLHESKYDDESVNFNSTENKENEKYEVDEAVIEGLNNNFSNLKRDQINFTERNEENLKGHVISPKNFLTEEMELKVNNILRSFKENLSTFSSSFKSQSYISVQEEYKHKDLDEGMAFKERRIYTIPPCELAGSTSTDDFWPSLLNLSIDEPLTNKEIRNKLISLGDNPGPVTVATRQLYLKRLMKLEDKAYNSSPSTSKHCGVIQNISRDSEHCSVNALLYQFNNCRISSEIKYYDYTEETGYKNKKHHSRRSNSPLPPVNRFRGSPETDHCRISSEIKYYDYTKETGYKNKKHHSRRSNSPLPPVNRFRGSPETDHYEYKIESFLRYGNWVHDLERYKIIENKIFKEYSKNLGEKISKDTFTYLLLDPRITNDLPSRQKNMTRSTVWSIFLSAVFYIGKGKGSRPLAHLKDAYNEWDLRRNSTNAKIERILDIWNENYGVVCLQVFQHCISDESMTREAAMIDAIGISKLTNCKRGSYYGIAERWNVEEKRNFGRYLLYQAMQIFFLDGERQIFPENF